MHLSICIWHSHRCPKTFRVRKFANASVRNIYTYEISAIYATALQLTLCILEFFCKLIFFEVQMICWKNQKKKKKKKKNVKRGTLWMRCEEGKLTTPR